MEDLNKISDEFGQDSFDEDLDKSAEITVDQSLKLATEALVAAYRRPYSPDGPSLQLAMEEQTEQKTFLQRFSEKVKAFFKWFVGAISKFFAFITGRQKKEEDFIKEGEAFERQWKGTDKLRPKSDKDVTDESESVQKSHLIKVREAYRRRKFALKKHIDSVCVDKPYLAALYTHRGREINEFQELALLVTDNITNMISEALEWTDDLREGSHDASGAIQGVNDLYDTYRKFFSGVFNNEDPVEGFATYLQSYKDQVRFQEVSPEDLLVMHLKVRIDAYEKVCTPINKASTVIHNLTKRHQLEGLNFDQFTVAGRTARYGEVFQERFEAIALVQKMLFSAQKVLTLLFHQGAMSEVLVDTVTTQYTAAQNAYESVKSTMAAMKATDDLPADAKALLEEMNREFA